MLNYPLKMKKKMDDIQSEENSMKSEHMSQEYT